MHYLDYFRAKLPPVRKFFFLTIISALLAFTTQAGDRIGIAPEIGLNFCNLSFSNAPGVTSYFKTGLKAGINFDKLISKEFSIQAGVFFTQLGAKMDATVVFVGPVTVPITINYAQVPITAVYKMDLKKGNLLFSAGPYVGYGLSISGTPGDPAFKPSNFKIGTDTASFIKPLDIGVNIAAAYQLHNGLSAKLGYAMGLTNIATGSGQTIRNSVWSISIAWFYRSAKDKKK